MNYNDLDGIKLNQRGRSRRTITIETSQFSTNPTKRWVGTEYVVEDFVVEYPIELEELDDDELCELADNGEKGVIYL